MYILLDFSGLSRSFPIPAHSLLVPSPPGLVQSVSQSEVGPGQGPGVGDRGNQPPRDPDSEGWEPRWGGRDREDGVGYRRPGVGDRVMGMAGWGSGDEVPQTGVAVGTGTGIPVGLGNHDWDESRPG